MWSANDRCFKLLDFDLSVELSVGEDSYTQQPLPSSTCSSDVKYQPVVTRGFIAPELYSGAAYSSRTDLASFCHQWLEEVVMYNGVSAEQGFEQVDEKIYQRIWRIVSALLSPQRNRRIVNRWRR